MADLQSFKEVVQLNEDMEYPEGYNCVEITGTGDEKQTRVFPSLAITGPSRMNSDGVTVAEIRVRINDPNSANPFQLAPNQFEEVTPSSPQELQVTYWITTLHGVYEDAGKTKQVPASFIEVKENMIYINDGWKASDAPDGWSGFYSVRAYVEYDGQYTLTIADGQQGTDKWWEMTDAEREAAEADDSESVTGDLYLDRDAVNKCYSGEIAIPNGPGQIAEVIFYYRPEAGESGIAYINAEWEETAVTHTITVIRGSYVGCSLSLTPDPSSLPEKTGDTSVCTLEAYDRDGAPLTGAVVNFYVQSPTTNGGSFRNGTNVELVEHLDQEDEAESSSKTEVSVSHPIVRIKSITVIGGAFVWNGQATISGSNITLIGQEFDTVNNIVPVKVTYDWGGECSATYVSSTASKEGDKIYVGATLGGGVNALATIDITAPDGGGPNIRIWAMETQIAKGASTPVYCTCENSEGDPVTSGITFKAIPKGTLNMAYDREPIVGEICSISDRKTFSTAYIIDTVERIEFDGDTYTAAAIDGNTVTITGDFGVAAGDVTCDYTPAGKWTGEYKSENDDYTAYLNASYADDGGDDLDTEIVQVGNGDGGGDFSLTLDVSPSSTKVNTTATCTATLLDGDGAVVGGESVTIEIISGPGVLSNTAKSFTGQTDGEGKLQTSLRSSASGTARVKASYESLSADGSCTFEPDDDGKGGEETMLQDPIYITGEVDPATKTFILTNGAIVSDWGIAEDADSFGCIDGDPANAGWEGMCKIYNSNNDAFAESIVSVSVSGGSLEKQMAWQSAQPSFLDSLEIGVPWQFELNTGREQIIRIVDKADEAIPIVGAKVTMGGRTSMTDGDGVAKFTGLGAGTYNVEISHPNYRDNRAGVTGGSGVWDSDPSNDTYVIKSYSGRLWKLKKLSINITITYTVKKEYYWNMDPND